MRGAALLDHEQHVCVTCNMWREAHPAGVDWFDGMEAALLCHLLFDVSSGTLRSAMVPCGRRQVHIAMSYAYRTMRMCAPSRCREHAHLAQCEPFSMCGCERVHIYEHVCMRSPAHDLLCSSSRAKQREPVFPADWIPRAPLP